MDKEVSPVVATALGHLEAADQVELLGIRLNQSDITFTVFIDIHHTISVDDISFVDPIVQVGDLAMFPAEADPFALGIMIKI
jgi:hypothetical protein